MSVNAIGIAAEACNGRCEAAARQAALTAENARLAATLRRQVAELERSRQQITAAEERLRREIAELLHSGVQTRLVVAWHRLGQVEKLIESDPTAARAMVGEVRGQIDQIREHEVRQASHLLHPSIIQVGLIPAIRSLSARFALYLELRVEVDSRLATLDDPGDNQIPEQLRLVAYRVVEEALNNIARHAEAKRVEIRLRAPTGGQLHVEVRDDGRGFEQARLEPGFGLNSVAARVAQSEGSWSIASAPGQGTVLTAILPLPAAQLEPAPEPSVARLRHGPIASRLQSHAVRRTPVGVP